MKVLVVGGGGREHALGWRLSRDPEPPRLWFAPGNAGTAGLGTNLPIGSEDLRGVADWARRERPDVVVVGPEAPLCAGLADELLTLGIRVFGPVAAAARLEGSKAFCKEILEAAGVPTARARRCSDPAEARAAVRELGAPVVIKADGLAAGKGVTVCRTLDEADRAIDDALVRGVFGDAGRLVLIEECLVGEEASVLALTDGERIAVLASAQDHKRVADGDQGPNTGGMGAYSPAPVVSDADLSTLRAAIFEPVLRELRRRGITYRGVLYAGLMITATGPRVLEFNCRFGDPETQAMLPRWQGSFSRTLLACADGRLNPEAISWAPGACVCVVMAAPGYPGEYPKGAEISGIEDAERRVGVVVFHAGTAIRDGRLVTAGGRVLGVTALGRDIREAVTRAYEAVGCIRFEGAHFRRDIAARALARGRG